MGGEVEGDYTVLSRDNDLTGQGTEEFRNEHNLHENDVICGKYAQTFMYHEGNIAFRDYLKSRCDEYKKLGYRLDHVKQVSEKIMDDFRKKGVRFITVSNDYEELTTVAKKKILPDKWVLAEDTVVKAKIIRMMDRSYMMDSWSQEGKMIYGMELPEEKSESNKRRKLVAMGGQMNHNKETGVCPATTTEINNRTSSTAGGTSHTTGIDFHNNRNPQYYPKPNFSPNWYQVKHGIKQDLLVRLSNDLQVENDRYCNLTAQVKTSGDRVHYLQNKILSLQQDLINSNNTKVAHGTRTYVNQNYVVPTGPPVFGSKINNGIMVRPSIAEYVNGGPVWGTNTNTSCMTTARLPIPPQTGIVPIQQEQQQEVKTNQFVHEQRQQQQMEQKRHQEQEKQGQMQAQQKRQKEKTNQPFVEPRREQQQQQKQQKNKNQEIQQNEQERHQEQETMLQQGQRQEQRQHSYSLSLASHNNNCFSTYYDNIFHEASTTGTVEETIIPTQITSSSSSTRIPRIEYQQQRRQQEVHNDNRPSVIEQLLQMEQQNRRSSSSDGTRNYTIPENILALLDDDDGLSTTS